MRPLTRKLLRDLLRNAGPVLTIALVIAIGIGGLTGFLGLYRDLNESRDRYYETYAYAHFQVSLRQAPLSALSELAGIPGIEALEPRIRRRASLRLPGVDRRLAVRLVSLPEYGEPVVNRIRILEGGLPPPGSRDAVVLIEDFAKARRLRPGDRFELITESTTRQVEVSGIAMAPEFVYVIPEDGGFIPDNRNYAVLWVRRSLAEDLYSLHGAFDDLVGRVGRDTPVSAVLGAVDRLLGRFGVQTTDDRPEMPPFALLDNEIRLTLIRATTVPTIFLLASALVLNLVVSRLIATQQAQIGTLKALGVSTLSILGHYVGFAMAISTTGALGGAWLGYELADLLARLYARFYHLPFQPTQVYPDIVLIGFLAATVAGLAGIARSARRILALTPAVAMRPSPPEVRGGVLVPRLAALPLTWRMALRNMFRHPFRTLVSSLGITVGVGIMMTSRFFLDSITLVNFYRFRVQQRHDLELTLLEGGAERSRFEIGRLAGVARVEGTLQYPFEIRSGPRTRRLMIEAVDGEAFLQRPRDLGGIPIELPGNGLLLGDGLAEVLGVAPGDEVELRELRGRRTTHRVRVAGTVPSFLGRVAWAERAWLGGLVQDPQALTLLSVAAPDERGTLESDLADMPGVLKVTRRSERIESFQEAIQGVLEVATWVLTFLAAAIACGMAVNGALVGIAERRTELAVLRVQGFSRGEVADILLCEHVSTGILGMLMGIPMGASMIAWVHSRAQTEILRLPFLISQNSLSFSLLNALVFVVLAHLVVRVLLWGHRWQPDLAVRE